jgi:zinc transporter ZupT
MASLWLAHAQTRPWTALGLGLSAIVTLWLLGASVARIVSGEAELALRSAGLVSLRAVAIAIASGLTEPIGALLGVGLGSGLALAYPIGLGLAAGAMIFVVSHEVIPETQRNGHQTSATVGLMTGFAIMMMLDTALG